MEIGKKIERIRKKEREREKREIRKLRALSRGMTWMKGGVREREREKGKFT